MTNKNMRQEGSAVPTGNGNPVPGAVNPDSRVSAPITEGHASTSTGDHGVGRGRSSGLAFRHPDLVQHRLGQNEFFQRLTTVAGDDQGDKSIIYVPGSARVQSLDLATMGGSYAGMNRVDHDPTRPDFHQHRQSPTPVNGSHCCDESCESHAVRTKQTMTGTEARAILKEYLFGG